jgi:hypothetical protein
MDFDFEAMRRSIEEFDRRTTYTSLDPDVIRSIDDSKLEQAIADFVIHKIGDRFGRYYEIVTSMPPSIQAIFATWILEAEVDNGGFNQYFWNISGELADEALAGLLSIGAPRHATALSGAMERVLAEGETWAIFRRRGTLEALADSYTHVKLKEFDQAFFAAGPLSPARIRYIREHVDEFTAA